MADDIFRERRTRQLKPEKKLSGGSELFEYAAGITLAGIHAQYPGISDGQTRQILVERLAMKERMENEAWTVRDDSANPARISPRVILAHGRREY